MSYVLTIVLHNQIKKSTLKSIAQVNQAIDNRQQLIVTNGQIEYSKKVQDCVFGRSKWYV